MMIKKVDTSFLGGAKRAKTSDFQAIMRFEPLIFQSVATNPTKLAEKVWFGILQLPTKFQVQFRTGKFYLEKIKISTRWPSSFQALFWTIISQTVRLVAFPRSL